MKACVIICEYNPFHTGHAYHIQQTKELIKADVYIGIMCNHFVQRGNIACVNAEKRAMTAIANGLDAIVELPYPYSVEAADKYAEGAIKLAKLLNADFISFGSECGDIEQLKEFAARESVVNRKVSKASLNINTNSNDILAIAYLRQLTNTTIQPYTIKRTSSYSSTELTEFASATALRIANQNNTNISKYTNLQNYMINPDISTLYPLIRYTILTLSKEYLSHIFLMEEGIENLLYKAALECEGFDEFIDFCTSKKYTRSRIMRTLIHLLLQTTKEEAEVLENESFIRILASNKKGLAYLKKLPASLRISKYKTLPSSYRNYIEKAEMLIHQRNTEDMAIELSYPILK